MAIKVALVDDHVLLRTGLATLISSFSGYSVHIEADNGQAFIKQLESSFLPNIVLMDISMPEMDGYQTTLWLKQHYPTVKVLALSMLDNEAAIIRMIKCGAKGYLLKDSDPSELKNALDTLAASGLYINELVSNSIIKGMGVEVADNEEFENNTVILKETEIEFLKQCCTDKTYREIADAMNYSPRTIDGFREALFAKLKLQTRVGLALFAVKNGIVSV